MSDLNTLVTTLSREATAKARAFVDGHPAAKQAKDAVYTAVGLGVVSAQKATNAFKTVHENANADSVKRGASDVTSNAKKQAAWLDDQWNKTIKVIDEALAPIEQMLPGVLKDVTEKARSFTSKIVTRSDAEAPATDTEPEGPAKAPRANKK